MSSRSDPKTVAVRGGMWEIPTMREVNEAKIDAKNRTSALTGLVKPGERYAISHVAPGKLVFTRMVEEKHEPVKVRRSWSGPKKGLGQHLDALADAGFTFEKHTFPNVTICKLT